MKSLLLAIFLFGHIVYANPLSVPTRPHFNFTQVATQDACGTFKNRRDSIGCNPAHYISSNYEGMTFFLITKTDGDSVDAGKKLLFDPLEKDDLRELFEMNSFNTWDANSFIEFRTGYFYLSYEPVYAMASFYLYNPVFPEISLTMASQKRINLTMGEEFGKNWKLSVGGSLYYFERNYFSGTFALTDVTSSGTDELIDIEKSHGINGDLGFLFESANHSWIPKLAMQMRNIGSKEKTDEDSIDSEVLMEPILLFEPYNKLDVGYDFNLKYGSLGLNAAFNFNQDFSEYYSDYSALAASYSLWDFDLMSSVSKFTQMAGIKFASSLSSIGIYFGRSKALGDFLDEPEDYAGVSVELYL